jgi:hypothetical protein
MTIHQRRDDYPNPWRIQVRGHPARRESISWREAIRDAVTDTYPQAPFTSPPLGTKFTVEVIFRMTPEDLARPAFDLDNFAKPVLDTLFTSQNVSRLTGVLLPGVNDTWVFRLLLEKVEVKAPHVHRRCARVESAVGSRTRRSWRSQQSYRFQTHRSTPRLTSSRRRVKDEAFHRVDNRE